MGWGERSGRTRTHSRIQSCKREHQRTQRLRAKLATLLLESHVHRMVLRGHLELRLSCRLVISFPSTSRARRAPVLEKESQSYTRGPWRISTSFPLPFSFTLFPSFKFECKNKRLKGQITISSSIFLSTREESILVLVLSLTLCPVPSTRIHTVCPATTSAHRRELRIWAYKRAADPLSAGWIIARLLRVFGVRKRPRGRR